MIVNIIATIIIVFITSFSFANDYRNFNVKDTSEQYDSLVNLIVIKTIEIKYDFSSHTSFLANQNSIFGVEPIRCQHELYEQNDEKSHDIIRKSVERAAVSTLSDLIQETPFGKKIKRISKKITKYTKAKYVKADDNSVMVEHPWKKKKKEIFTDKKIKYGVELSADVIENLDDSALNLNYFYDDTKIITSFKPFQQKVAVDISNDSFSQWMGCKTSIEAAVDDSETHSMLKFGFDF